MATPRTETAEPQPVFYVQVRGEERGGQQFQIGPDGLLVGRSSVCDLIFTSREVSRRHAYFYSDGERCYVEDLASKNGVLVNGRPVKRQALAGGDAIDVGPFRLIFRVSGPARARSLWLASNLEGGEFGTASLAEAGRPAPGRNALAISSVVFSSLTYLHWAFGIGAVVLALLALVETRQQRDRASRALALAGIVVGISGALLNGWFTEASPRLRERASLAAQWACRENLAAIRDALQEHAAAHGGAPARSVEALVAAGLLEQGRLECPGCGLRAGHRCGYLLVPGGPPGARGAGDVVACDSDPEAHQGRGGWVLRGDGRIQWASASQLRHLLRELRPEGPPPARGPGPGG